MAGYRCNELVEQLASSGLRNEFRSSTLIETSSVIYI